MLARRLLFKRSIVFWLQYFQMNYANWEQTNCHRFFQRNSLLFGSCACVVETGKCLKITFSNNIAVNDVCKWAIARVFDMHACRYLSSCFVCCSFFLSLSSSPSVSAFPYVGLSLKDAGMWFVNEEQIQIKQSQQHSTHQHQQPLISLSLSHRSNEC